MKILKDIKASPQTAMLDSREALRRRYEEMMMQQKEVMEGICRHFFPHDVFYQEELIQVMAQRLWDRMDGASRDVHTTSWCKAVAWQAALDYMRSRPYKESKRTVLSADMMDDVADPDAESDMMMLDNLLLQLDSDDYELIELHLSRMPHKEIARQQGMALRTLQYRLKEIEKKLIAIHKRMCGDVSDGVATAAPIPDKDVANQNIQRKK